MSEYVEIDAQELNDYISSLEDENEALKAQVELLRESEAYFKNGMAELQDYIDKMDPELLALRAQVEQLRAAGNALRKPWDLSKILGAETRMLVQQWDVVAAATPAQCLAEVNAHAGRDGFIAGYFHCRNEGFQFEDELENSADAYANQIRQQAKRE